MPIGSSHSALCRISARSASRICRNCSRQPVRVAVDLLLRQARAGLRPARTGSPTRAGEVADDQDRRVPRILELAELAEHDGPSEGDGGRGRDRGRASPAAGGRGASLARERLLRHDVGGAARRVGQVVAVPWRRMLPVGYRATGPEGRLATAMDRRLFPSSPASLVFALVATACGLPQHRGLRAAAARADLLPLRRRRLADHRAARRARTAWCSATRQMPQSIRDAAVAIEDRRFYWHHGFDVRAIVRAAYVRTPRPGEVVEGGSTITQQLVKNLYVGDGRHVPAQDRRGGPRVAARGAADQGPDPHAVPQHRVLRRGRVRRAGGGADLLRRVDPTSSRWRSRRCSPASSPRRTTSTPYVNRDAALRPPQRGAAPDATSRA